VRAVPLFLRDYLKYRRQPGAERLTLADTMPALHERSADHELDAHYFYVNAWAVRRVLAHLPQLHVDVGSQVVFSSILAASLPVVFFDYRPLRVAVSGLHSVAGDILRLPLADASINSLSCLHVAEHIGLGRYGDAIDPAGTRKAAAELARVLAPAGTLLFAVPVGRERVVFNAHRVHDPATICSYFPSLTLREFSGVDDRGAYAGDLPLDVFRGSEYACGMFEFAK
jgi:SAM-dependent methyltransferase